MKIMQGEKKKAIVLFSGGLDSTTTLYIAMSESFDVYPISFDYKQRHAIELQFAAMTLSKIKDDYDFDLASRWKIIRLDFSQVMGSALVDKSMQVPKNRDESKMSEEIPVSYVPLRNTIFLAYAASYAESIGARDIFAGMNCQDYSGYPDCRPKFVDAMERSITLGSKLADMSDEKFKIHTPLMNMNKKQIIEEGTKLGVDYNFTWSCYDPRVASGRIEPCDTCDSCILRRKGFDDSRFFKESVT